MGVPPPYIAELPLKVPEAGAFRLLPGQVLRARVTAVTGEGATLDFGYASLQVKLAVGTELTAGARVLLQVQSVGPDRLQISLLPEATPPQSASVALAVPDSGTLLRSLGFPQDDPLLALARQLQQSPAGQGIPSPVLAALVLTFGPDADKLLPQVAQLLRERRTASSVALPSSLLQRQQVPVGEFLGWLEALLQERTATPESVRTGLASWRTLQDDGVATLSLALSGLAGHQVRYMRSESRDWSLVLEERPWTSSAEGAVSRFLAQMELPRLGNVSLQCLLTPVVCLGRCHCSEEAAGVLQPVLATAVQQLTDRLGRPVHLTIDHARPQSPLQEWLDEQPWLARGQAQSGAGIWVDESV
ncbi:MAG: hypothetical protein GEEBNDBF_00726 [bacterium]|nr:hypothetical protein [bacterium]